MGQMTRMLPWLGAMVAAIQASGGAGYDRSQGKPMTPDARERRDANRSARAAVAVPRAEAKRARRRQRNLYNRFYGWHYYIRED